MENVNWNECILCQKITDESLKEPSKNNNKAEVQNTYENVVDILKQYHHAGAMPDSFHTGVINFIMNSDHPSILHKNKAKWHSSCKSKVTISKLQRKRKHQPEEPSKETRSKVAKFEKNTCFIPGCTTKTTENEPLHEVMSKELDARFREYASIMDDTELLVKLAGGTLITLEAKYHSPCAVMYFNRVKAKVRDEQSTFRKMKNYRYSALQDLVNELEESRYDTETNAFLVSDLVERYNKKLANILPETLGEPPKTHITRLKDDLLAEIPDLQYHKKGKTGYLIFNDKIAGLIHQDFTSNQDENDSKTLRDALRILRQDIFSVENRFNGSLSDKDSQIDSVPLTLLSFICRLMGGAGTEDENKSIPQATCTLTQLVYSNSVKRRRKDSEGNPRQQRCRETPIGIYVGLLLHNATGSESLVDAMFKLGLSISYDRVQEIRKNLGSQICEQFLDSGAVWGYTLPKDTPKAYGFDNANKISSSNTTSGSANFNGTVISVFSFGQSDEPSKIFKVNEGGSNAKLELPKYYTDIEPVINEKPTVPSVAKKDLTGDSSAVHKNSLNAEIKWMDKVQDSVRKNTTVEKLSNLSWAAYFASREEQVKKETVTSQILPVFIEEAATPSMVKHCLTVILKCHEYTNPGEVPWVTADQPLYALLKTIQWRFPETHGEDKLFGVMGALHIEKAAWTCVGQVEDGSGTISLMADADVSTIGVAESCLHCSHISRSRYLNTVGACVHYMLLCDAYQEYKDQLPNGSEPIDMFKWCEEQKSPMFRYHYLLLKLKLLVLQFVRSVRSGDQSLYLTSLTKITYYFFALNHVHYSRWTPVHIRDMLLLPETHPEIHHHFEQGRFTINKTGRRFSNIGLDHGQEQNIKRFKEHGGPLPFTHSPDQLLLYLVAGPEVTNQVAFFQSLMSPVACSTVCHHEQTKAYQNKFIEHTKSLYSKYLEVGNVFTDKSNVLFDLSTDQVKPPTTIDSIMSLESRGKEQYETFVKDRLVKRSVPITEKIPKNKLSLMKEIKKAKSKAQDVKDLKNLAAVLSQLYVVSQVRGADPTEFFSHENVPNPPSISKDGQLYHGTKSDLAEVLGGLSAECLASQQPTSDAVVLDGPAIIHMVAPKNGSTVDEYSKVFAAHVNSYFKDVNRVDVIFDIYLDSSLKEGVRETRGTAPSQIVKGTTKISKWSKFLKNSSNKQRLFEYIAHYLKSQVTPSNNKQLIVTCRDMVITNPISVGLEEILSPCDHEEADTRMILHASNILEDLSSVTLRTVDTDVLVLAVALSNKYPTKRIWVSFGVGDQKKMFSAHEIRIQVGPEKAQALPMFHAFTGCDTVSSFKNVGKKTAWERWASFDDVTDAFLHLTESPDDLNKETEALLERFAILLYDKTSPLTSINLLRKELFNRGRSIEKIPPTSGALVQHSRRTTLQGGHCWGKSTQNKMNLPPVTGWGWLDNKQPLWTVDPIASKACKQLTKCGCKAKDGIFKCSGPCGCKRSQQNCTDLCKCKGSCKWWEDNDEDSSDDDEDDGSVEPQAIENEDLEEYSN